MPEEYDPLPHSSEAERAVLGAVLLDNELITQAIRYLKPDDLYVPSHRRIYVAMIALFEKSRQIDPISIGEVLRKDKSLESVGGISYVTNLTYGLPHSTNIKDYADIIRGHAKSRWLMRFADKIKATIKEGNQSSNDIAKWIMEQVGDTQDHLDDLSEPKSIDELYADQELRYMMFHKGVTDAIPTGFSAIDEKLLGGGLIPSFFYILAGRPSMGKSTLALDISANAAEAGYRVLIVTKEMQREVLIDRFVSAKSGVQRFKIQAGMSKNDYERALEGLSAMRLYPIVFDHSSDTVEEIDGWIGDFERKDKRIDLLVVDYVQLMMGDKSGNRTGEVSGVSRGLKRVAMKRKIPVLGVSQLTRAPGRENREPELYDLRESGQLEQDADGVWFLHGDDTTEGIILVEKQLLCKKQREGPHFRRPMDMNTELVTFRTQEMLGLRPIARKVIAREGTQKESEKRLLQSKTRSQRTLQEPTDDEQDI